MLIVSKQIDNPDIMQAMWLAQGFTSEGRSDSHHGVEYSFNDQGFERIRATNKSIFFEVSSNLFKEEVSDLKSYRFVGKFPKSKSVNIEYFRDFNPEFGWVAALAKWNKKDGSDTITYIVDTNPLPSVDKTYLDKNVISSTCDFINWKKLYSELNKFSHGKNELIRFINHDGYVRAESLSLIGKPSRLHSENKWAVTHKVHVFSNKGQFIESNDLFKLWKFLPNEQVYFHARTLMKIIKIAANSNYVVFNMNVLKKKYHDKNGLLRLEPSWNACEFICDYKKLKIRMVIMPKFSTLNNRPNVIIS